MHTASTPRQRRNRMIRIAVLAVLAICISACLVAFTFARNTYTIIDGNTVTEFVSASRDPHEVLDQAGISLADDDLVTGACSGGKGEIIISRRQTVTVTCDGTRQDAVTYGTTVGTLLDDLHIALADADTLAAADGSPVATSDTTRDGMNLTVTRYSEDTVKEQSEIPYTTLRYTDTSLAAGETEVLQAGERGVLETTYRVSYTDDQQTDRVTEGAAVLTEPVDEILLVGAGTEISEGETALAVYTPPVEEVVEEQEETAPEASETPRQSAASETADLAASASSASDSSSDSSSSSGSSSASQSGSGTSSGSSASSESGSSDSGSSGGSGSSSGSASSGNTITTSSGEVLSYSSTLSMTATAYTGGGLTASGTSARYGAIAVDPSVIPLGTKLYVVSNDGAYVYGVCYAEDTGGAIKGSIIDLYYDSYDTCISFGRRGVTVYVLS